MCQLRENADRDFRNEITRLTHCLHQLIAQDTFEIARMDIIRQKIDSQLKNVIIVVNEQIRTAARQIELTRLERAMKKIRLDDCHRDIKVYDTMLSCQECILRHLEADRDLLMRLANE